MTASLMRYALDPLLNAAVGVPWWMVVAASPR